MTQTLPNMNKTTCSVYYPNGVKYIRELIYKAESGYGVSKVLRERAMFGGIIFKRNSFIEYFIQYSLECITNKIHNLLLVM